MRVLFVDIALAGHHLPYLKSAAISDNYNVFILPETTEELCGIQYVVKYQYQSFDIGAYMGWLQKIKKVADDEEIDVIHFVYADILLKYFGFGLNIFGGKKVVLSFHRLDNQKAKNFARNLIVGKVNAITTHIIGGEYLLRENVKKKHFFVAYPSTYEGLSFSHSQAKKDLEIDTALPVISVVGKLSSYKSLDVMFSALSKVKLDYFLLIAGEPGFFTEEYITSEVKKLGVQSKLILDYISDEDFMKCIAAADIVAVTYNKSFEGTSGPMTEGIRLKKTIVGCAHSNIGKYISKYHIGYAADIEDVEAIAKCFTSAIKNPISYGRETDELINMQTIEGFRKRLKYIYENC